MGGWKVVLGVFETEWLEEDFLVLERTQPVEHPLWHVLPKLQILFYLDKDL